MSSCVCVCVYVCMNMHESCIGILVLDYRSVC